MSIRLVLRASLYQAVRLGCTCFALVAMILLLAVSNIYRHGNPTLSPTEQATALIPILQGEV